MPCLARVPCHPVRCLDSASHYTIGFPLSAVAPSGAAPVGLGFVGLNVLGSDCVINGILWP
jgi:hypothetical protein